MSKDLIIDASVLAKWLLADEKENFHALRIKNDFTNRTISIKVPIFVYSEVNNLLKSAAIRKRINPETAIKVYEDFLYLDFIVYSLKELSLDTLKIALKYDISSYDATYVALAEYLQIPLFTADEKLVKKTQSSLVKNLSDY